MLLVISVTEYLLQILIISPRLDSLSISYILSERALASRLKHQPLRLYTVYGQSFSGFWNLHFDHFFPAPLPKIHKLTKRCLQMFKEYMTLKRSHHLLLCIMEHEVTAHSCVWAYGMAGSWRAAVSLWTAEVRLWEGSLVSLWSLQNWTQLCPCGGRLTERGAALLERGAGRECPVEELGGKRRPKTNTLLFWRRCLLSRGRRGGGAARPPPLRLGLALGNCCFCGGLLEHRDRRSCQHLQSASIKGALLFSFFGLMERGRAERERESHWGRDASIWIQSDLTFLFLPRGLAGLLEVEGSCCSCCWRGGRGGARGDGGDCCCCCLGEEASSSSAAAEEKYKA